MSDIFSEVRPNGWLGDRLRSISNPRKWRWNAYLRACKGIPADSPVHGSTSWKRINERRLSLIDNRSGRNEKEFVALQEVAGQVVAGSLVAQNFLLQRVARRLKAKHRK